MFLRPPILLSIVPLFAGRRLMQTSSANPVDGGSNQDVYQDILERRIVGAPTDDVCSQRRLQRDYG